MVSSRVDGSNLTLPKCRSQSPPHGILKENLLLVRTFDAVEDLRRALLEFRETYNNTWLIERRGYLTAEQFRQKQLQPNAIAA
jgi:hypothetical protein